MTLRPEAGARHPDGLHDAVRGYSYVSSRLVKEWPALGGDVPGLVPPDVVSRLKNARGGRADLTCRARSEHRTRSAAPVETRHDIQDMRLAQRLSAVSVSPTLAVDDGSRPEGEGVTSSTSGRGSRLRYAENIKRARWRRSGTTDTPTPTPGLLDLRRRSRTLQGKTRRRLGPDESSPAAAEERPVPRGLSLFEPGRRWPSTRPTGVLRSR